MYKLSVTAIRQYRAGAKNDKNIPDEVLSAKINCMIKSTDIINTRYIICGTLYQFGTCKIEVNRDGYIRKISWSNTNTILKSESDALKQNYKRYGLNSKGNKFINN